jgi:hypothetical protein
MNLVWSWTHGFAEIWFFREVFVTVGKNAKKPGLLGVLTARVAINRGFMRILRYRAKRWEKNPVYEGFEPQVFLLAPR